MVRLPRHVVLPAAPPQAEPPPGRVRAGAAGAGQGEGDRARRGAAEGRRGGLEGLQRGGGDRGGLCQERAVLELTGSTFLLNNLE